MQIKGATGSAGTTNNGKASTNKKIGGVKVGSIKNFSTSGKVGSTNLKPSNNGSKTTVSYSPSKKQTASISTPKTQTVSITTSGYNGSTTINQSEKVDLNKVLGESTKKIKSVKKDLDSVVGKLLKDPVGTLTKAKTTADKFVKTTWNVAKGTVKALGNITSGFVSSVQGGLSDFVKDPAGFTGAVAVSGFGGIVKLEESLADGLLTLGVAIGSHVDVSAAEGTSEEFSNYVEQKYINDLKDETKAFVSQNIAGSFTDSLAQEVGVYDKQYYEPIKENTMTAVDMGGKMALMGATGGIAAPVIAVIDAGATAEAYGQNGMSFDDMATAGVIAGAYSYAGWAMGGSIQKNVGSLTARVSLDTVTGALDGTQSTVTATVQSINNGDKRPIYQILSEKANEQNMVDKMSQSAAFAGALSSGSEAIGIAQKYREKVGVTNTKTSSSVDMNSHSVKNVDDSLKATTLLPTDEIKRRASNKLASERGSVDLSFKASDQKEVNRILKAADPDSTTVLPGRKGNTNGTGSQQSLVNDTMEAARRRTTIDSRTPQVDWGTNSSIKQVADGSDGKFLLRQSDTKEINSRTQVGETSVMPRLSDAENYRNELSNSSFNARKVENSRISSINQASDNAYRLNQNYNLPDPDTSSFVRDYNSHIDVDNAVREDGSIFDRARSFFENKFGRNSQNHTQNVVDLNGNSSSRINTYIDERVPKVDLGNSSSVTLEPILRSKDVKNISIDDRVPKVDLDNSSSVAQGTRLETKEAGESFVKNTILDSTLPAVDGTLTKPTISYEEELKHYRDIVTHNFNLGKNLGRGYLENGAGNRYVQSQLDYYYGAVPREQRIYEIARLYDESGIEYPSRLKWEIGNLKRQKVEARKVSSLDKIKAMDFDSDNTQNSMGSGGVPRETTFKSEYFNNYSDARYMLEEASNISEHVNLQNYFGGNSATGDSIFDRGPIALQVITPKQSVGAVSEGLSDHGSMYGKLVNYIYDNDSVIDADGTFKQKASRNRDFDFATGETNSVILRMFNTNGHSHVIEYLPEKINQYQNEQLNNFYRQIANINQGLSPERKILYSSHRGEEIPIDSKFVADRIKYVDIADTNSPTYEVNYGDRIADLENHMEV